MAPRFSSRDSGFTLVEMLVSLALLAMAAMMMATGFSSGARLWAREEQRTSAGQSVEAVQSLIRDRIERLRPVTRSEGDKLFSDLDGDAGHFTFIALPTDTERPAPMRRYSLSLDDRGELMLSSTGKLDDSDAPEQAVDKVMLRRVQAMDISYYGPDPSGGSPGWRQEWSDRETPPELVRVRLRFASGDPRTWPELIMRPAASVDTLCTIMAETGKCRGRS